MIREEKFLISNRPYAVDLSSLRTYGSLSVIRAVWFRRRRGVTVACTGILKGWPGPPPGDAVEFLRNLTDGRYGGSAEGRWDGSGYWGSTEDVAIMHEHLNLLRPMLADYPDAPDGYDGWWRFE